MTSCFQHDGLRLLGEIIKSDGGFPHHVHAGGNQAANRNKSNTQRQQCRAAGRKRKLIVNQRTAKHGNQSLCRETANSRVPQPDRFPQMLSAALQQPGLVQQAGIQLRVLACSGHYSSNRAGSVHYAGNSVPQSKHQHGGGIGQQGGRYNGGQNCKRTFSNLHHSIL